ncbi:MAG TPA: PAS domain S-box protein, partial [Blastocatellia bacterium]|nr:PAS domain S-box protein [Blastocatellia bacterium]
MYTSSNELAGQEAIEKDARLISAVLETAGALIVVLDSEGRITRFNRACEEMTGYSFEEVRGKHVWDVLIIPEEVEAVKSVFQSLRSGEILHQFENYWITRSGERRLIAWNNGAITDSSGVVRWVVGVGTDITLRKQTEEELRLSLKELADIKFALDESSIVAITDQKGV